MRCSAQDVQEPKNDKEKARVLPHEQHPHTYYHTLHMVGARVLLA